ncbi:hypothetical protein B5F39_07435 [Cloacibacillus sp. An23]|nr:hypothetical protein B5F39_07435 [Cloacibacillus sp. An23]
MNLEHIDNDGFYSVYYGIINTAFIKDKCRFINILLQMLPRNRTIIPLIRDFKLLPKALNRVGMNVTVNILTRIMIDFPVFITKIFKLVISRKLICVNNRIGQDKLTKNT